MANRTLRKNNKSKTAPLKRKDYVFSASRSVVMFGFSILLFFLVVVPGENLWLWLHNFIFGMFGVCSILWPILVGTVAILDAMGKSGSNVQLKLWVSVATIIFACSLFYVFSCAENNQDISSVFSDIFSRYRAGEFDESSGLFGALLGIPSVWAFGVIGARIINIIIIFMCLMFLTSATLMDFFGLFSKPAKAIKQKIEDRNIEREAKKNPLIDVDLSEKRKEKSEKIKSISSSEKDMEIGENETDDISKVTEKFLSKIKNENERNEKIKTTKSEEKSKEFEVLGSSGASEKHYKFPDVNLLNDAKKPDDGDITTELNNNGKMLVDTLKSFNVSTKIIDISRGPAVTRYELQPAAGVKISKITTLADDIALNLAASGVRIEAPIPGKAAVGIEIPNKVVSMVSMKELIVSPEFKHAKSKLTVVLGRDISGDIMTADLAKMPHLLIAGSTGSGKSVCINSFIVSILYNAHPDEVKLLMVDPKVVELGVYNGIPHLLVPVVTDPRKAAGALNWAVNEMLIRYKKFAETGVRDLASYNQMIDEKTGIKDKSGEPLEKMPQIVIIIDELSDLMMAAPNEVEDYICRLAQMARAAGMHLVIATQRPSVDVITGIIKANIPSRIALAVSSQIDSRTILDMSGAEKLLGRGDMLFAPVGCNKPIRVQGCYVTDREIERVVESIKTTEESNYDEEIAKEIEKGAVSENSSKGDSKVESSVDPMMAEAVKCVVEAGQASTSLLQRRLRVGYARAGRLVDEMEQMGIVGPHEGSKPRQVLITYQQFLEMNLNNAQ